MSAASTVKRGPAGVRLLFVCALLVPLSSYADPIAASGFALRNQNPFLQIYGLPTFQSASLAEHGHNAWNLSFDLANHADFGKSDIENFIIDGETYFLTLSMRRRTGDRLELGFDLPLAAHSDGVMDDMIEGWHDIFGMSNTKRRGPSNELAFLYQRDGVDRYRLDAPVSGLGDLQLTAAIPIRPGTDGATNLTVRTNLKLPTGDSDKLLGSGATDFAVGLYATSRPALFDRPLELSGFVGGLVLAAGDELPDLKKDVDAFGGVAATGHWTGGFALTTQLYGQSPYYKSDVEELGGNSMQLAFGAEITLSEKILLRLAIVEDVSANATTDFALHFSVGSGAAR